MSQRNFICPSRCIDFVPLGEKLYACCKDGIYELKLYDDDDAKMDFDEADDDIFSDAKRPCLMTSQTKDVDGVLRVKFKREALCFAVIADKVLLSLHLHRNGSQAFLE